MIQGGLGHMALPSFLEGQCTLYSPVSVSSHQEADGALSSLPSSPSSQQ